MKSSREIIAHRGASFDAPENTVAAARLAWEQGADALELDVRLTNDGQLAVIHDADTKRIAGAALTVNQATMAELKRLDVGRGKHAPYPSEEIPTLDEMLTITPAGKRVFIEIKGGLEIVSELGRCFARCAIQPEQLVIISFDLAVARAAKKNLPHIEVAWILDYDAATRSQSVDDLIRQCRDGGLDGLDLGVGWPIDAALVNRIHQAGLKVFVWTVDDPAVARRLENAGVDGFTTNRPGWLRDQLGG